MKSRVDTYRFDSQGVIKQIIAFNHAWKLTSNRRGADSRLAQLLRNQKSLLQTSLLREGYAFLVIDNEAEEEPLFSVRLVTPLVIDGKRRKDAEHMPVRVAKKLFEESELEQLLRN